MKRTSFERPILIKDVARLLKCGPGAQKLFLRKCSKRKHRRNVSALNDHFFNVWALRVQIGGHGGLSPVQANVERKTI